MATDSFNDAVAGGVFSQSTTPLGLAFPIYTGTALGGGALPIWNPPKSGVNVEILEVSTARTSGTATFGAIGVMIRALDSIATGQIMTAMATTAPINALFGIGNASRCQSSNAGTNTVTAGVAGDWIRTLFTYNLEADTGTAHPTTVAQYRFNGDLIVPPGNLIYLASTTATTALFATTIVWREVLR